MAILRRWIIRIVMTCLCFAALCTTFQAFSGIEVFSLIQSYVRPLFEPVSAEAAALMYTASENKNATLEDMDWSKYHSITVIATGYTAGIESTGKHPDHPSYGITYSGVHVKRDLFSTIAADLRVFPIGTILFIPGYGYGVVADKGSAIQGNKIDLYYETVQDVYNSWGKRNVNVYVIKVGNGTLTEQDLVRLNEDETLQVFRQQYQRKQ